MSNVTVPPLHDEVERINFDAAKIQFGGGEKVKEAFREVNENNSVALQIRYEDSDDIFVTNIDSTLTYYEMPGEYQREVYSIRDIVHNGVRDINRLPLKRCPVVGDGSAYYTCAECSQPVVKDERAYDTVESGSYGTFHKKCLSN